MAAKKHTYIIAVNQFSYGQDDLCTYTYNRTPFEISARDNRAQVKYQLTTVKSAEAVIRGTYAGDALRKMHLYHIMRSGGPLHVRKIIVSIDGVCTTFTREDPGFPFVITMLGTRDLGLPDVWKDHAFHQTVLGATKTAAADDLRFVCLYSFLAGTGKRFQVDRFTCYWTAINAHYSYLLSRYRETDDMKALAENKQKKLNTGGERTAISALLNVLGCGSSKSPKSFGDNYRDLLYSFRRIDRSQLDSLYDQLYAHRTAPGYIPPGYDEDPRDLGCQLQALRQLDPGLTTSAYGCILLDYAYYMRCEYLHGSHTPPLFVNSNDPEIAAFRVLNLFLERYLKDHIPAMFGDNWMDEEKRSAVHKLLIDEMNTRTIDCLMAAKNRDEINMDDFTA